MIWLVWIYAHSELVAVCTTLETAKAIRDELIREYGYGIKCAVDRVETDKANPPSHPSLTWLASASWDTEWLKEMP